MIAFSRFELENGLRVIHHEDNSTPMVALNVLYNVGSKDESPEKTGFAHLFEHLMFGGSVNVPDFDGPIQTAGGENNAFTNNDITNFYDLLPAENIETAFWLESDRMLGLNFDEKVLDVQRKVVVEEFKETCLNQPYGDAWHHISDLAYKVHPYRWPTIGKVPKHVEDATIEDVKTFFYNYYRPNNAIVVVSGNIDAAKTKALSEKWFGDIPSGIIPARNIPQEPAQKKLQQRINQAKVPNDALYLAFHSPSRTHPDFYPTDLLSDILCNGSSSRLYRRLLKEQQLFTQIDCYLTGSVDPGLFIIEGHPAKGVSQEAAEKAIWRELEEIRAHSVPERELQKIKNRIESTLVFSELNVLNKAINLAFFELLGDADYINQEVNLYKSVTIADLRRIANEILTPENCSELYYQAQNH
ncbi:MAG: insulinase family protein [Saprospiraceae bacterium]|nr:insulinase family protein [Saprospiraceae bacterium]